SGTGSWLADALAVTAGAAFAVNTVTLRRVAGQSRSAIAFSMFVGAAVLPAGVALLLGAAGTTVPVPLAVGPWGFVVLGTGVAYVLGMLVLQYGAARLPANTTSLIMLTEVAVAAISGALIAGEVLSWRVIVGGTLIVIAAASSLVTPAPPARGMAQP